MKRQWSLVLFFVICLLAAPATSAQANQINYDWSAHFGFNEVGQLVVTYEGKGWTVRQRAEGVYMMADTPNLRGDLGKYTRASIESNSNIFMLHGGANVRKDGDLILAIVAPENVPQVKRVLEERYGAALATLPQSVRRELGRALEVPTGPSANPNVDGVIEYNAACLDALRFPNNDSTVVRYRASVVPKSQADTDATKMLNRFSARSLTNDKGFESYHKLRILFADGKTVRTTETTRWHSQTQRRFKQDDNPHTYTVQDGKVANDDFQAQ